MKIKCVACGLVHNSRDRIECLKHTYTMCPKCKCGGFNKVSENDNNNN